jgi:high-affinity iron transporter
MLGALIIVFREVIEAGLIIGIVLAASREIPGNKRWVALGVAGGIAGSVVVAIFAGAISDAFAGAGQELFNAGVLGTAVVMLTWHNVWMARHSREIVMHMQDVGAAVSAGTRPLTALAIVVGLAVLREGSEIVLFLYGVLASGTTGASVLTGGIFGILLGAAFSALTYYGLLAIPLRHIFSVTAILIALLAAGMAAQAAHFLDAAGLITVLGQQLWDTSGILPEDSLLGRVLHTLIGYTDRPTELQLIAYLATLFVMMVLMRIARPAQTLRAMA